MTVHAHYNQKAKRTVYVHNDYKTLISYDFPMKKVVARHGVKLVYTNGLCSYRNFLQLWHKGCLLSHNSKALQQNESEGFHSCGYVTGSEKKWMA